MFAKEKKTVRLLAIFFVSDQSVDRCVSSSRNLHEGVSDHVCQIEERRSDCPKPSDGVCPRLRSFSEAAKHACRARVLQIGVGGAERARHLARELSLERLRGGMAAMEMLLSQAVREHEHGAATGYLLVWRKTCESSRILAEQLS